MHLPRRTSRFDSAIALGTGHVVQHRYRHAFRRLRDQGLLENIAYLDIHALDACPLERVSGEHYFPLQNNQIPFGDLTRSGLLRGNPLFIVAVCSPLHAHYAFQALQHGFAVAIEKPTVKRSADALNLLRQSGTILPVEHFAFKAAALRMLYRCRERLVPDFATAFTGVRVRILEAKPADPHRMMDNMIWDLAWHALALIRMSLTLQGFLPYFELHQVLVANHSGAGELMTAARLQGRLFWQTGAMPFDVQVGKGIVDAKDWTMFRQDRADWVIPIGEGGHRAHERQLRHILTQPTDRQLFNMRDAADLVALCEQAEELSRETGTYDVGMLPPLFRDEAGQQMTSPGAF